MLITAGGLLCWDLSRGKWSRLLLLPLYCRTKSPTSQKQACKAIIAQMEKLKGPPPLTVSRLTMRPWFSSQTEKGNPILFEKTGRSFFSSKKIDYTNYTQKPNISTAGCWETIEPPLAALSPQNTLQETNCRIWVEAEPWSPLKAHQNCNKTPLFEMKLSNCYFTPTFCWSPFKSSPLTLFQMKMFSFLGSGRGLIYAAPCTSEVWAHMQKPKELDMTAKFQDGHHQKSWCLPPICHLSSSPRAWGLEVLMWKKTSYLELVLYSLGKGIQEEGAITGETCLLLVPQATQPTLQGIWEQ